jgi:hypothetical protein
VYARVTLLEIDTVRIGVEEAVELFESQVLPRLREQEEFEGVWVLGTPDGKGLLISLWATEEAAEASAETGFYPEILAEYVTLFRAPPGRERYQVMLAETPSAAIE